MVGAEGAGQGGHMGECGGIVVVLVGRIGGSGRVAEEKHGRVG